jgi:uncharacterized repeat protein (TIGR02543 family)
MFKNVISKSLLLILALSAAWRVNGKDQFTWGNILSTQFGTFYADGGLNPVSSGVLLPFAYYNLDDCTGTSTVLDSSGYGRHTSHPYGNTINYSAAGLAGTALWTVPGSGGFPVHADITAAMAGDFTFATWFRNFGTETYLAIFYTPLNNSQCFSMINIGGGYLLCDFGGGTSSFSVNMFPTWHHIVFSKSGSAVSVYYDGASLGSVPVGGQYSTNWRLFDSEWSGYSGTLADELKFFNVALTAQQVTDLYESYDHPEFVTVYFNTSFFQADMGNPGACNLEYGAKVYVEGDQIGAFPALTSNDPRYVFNRWAYTMGDRLETWSTVYDGLEACAYWDTVSSSCTLYFDSQGGSTVPDYWGLYEGFTFEIPYLGNVWPADPVYDGYVFAGWFNGAEGTGTPITAQGIYDSMTFGSGYIYAFAHWTLPPITFTFNSGVPACGWGTTQTDIPGIENHVTYDYTEITYGAGAEITALPSASVTGPRYTFAGYWYDPYYSVVYQAGSFAPTSIYPYEGSFPLFAMWDDGGFEGTLAFDSMDGTPVTLTKNLFDGSDFGTGDFGELSWPENPTRPGYVFDGWNTQADGQGLAGVTYATQYVSAYGTTVTLYAMWVAE